MTNTVSTMNEITAAAAAAAPTIDNTASLILCHRPNDKIVIIIGTGKLASSRADACLDAGARPLILDLSEGSVIASTATSSQLGEHVVADLSARIAGGEVAYRVASDAVRKNDEVSWQELLDDIDGGDSRNIFALCITDTLHLSEEDANASTSSSTSPQARALLLQQLCRSRRIPINVADRPALCDFSFPASHRFPCNRSSEGVATGVTKSSLQIAVTTNGQGCRLAGRIRREIVSSLPRNVGDAVERVGEMREIARYADSATPRVNGQTQTTRLQMSQKLERRDSEEDLSFDRTPLNKAVAQITVSKASQEAQPTAGSTAERSRDEERSERTKRRMRWVAQISEYWPIDYLGGMTNAQMRDALGTYGEAAVSACPPASAVGDAVPASEAHDSTSSSRGRMPSRDDESSAIRARRASSHHALDIGPPAASAGRKGHIYLLGSGPGHPGLLTVLAHRVLTSPDTHLILSDKLVPSSILRLIPSNTPLVIAKKFPGNAEGAQSELIALALKAAKEEGKNVVRLKQGDPFVYGRGGEEVLAFRKAGVECTVVPGISSALAAPALLGIPVTQRGAADSLLLCTGVGRGGKEVRLPGYERSRSLVLLMGVARLGAIVAALTAPLSSQSSHRSGAPFPPYTPIAIIERASSSDQRLIASTLEGIQAAQEREGEQRPPGMIMIGWAVLSLEGKGETRVADDAEECGVMGEKAEEALEDRDRERIKTWLGGREYIRREGLDEAYSAALASLTPMHDHTDPNGASSAPAPVTNGDASVIGLEGPVHAALATRSATGWLPSRYVQTNKAPTGGWLPNELGTNKPAADEGAYQRDREYAQAT